MPTRRAVVLGAAFLVCVAFVACGGDDDSALDEIEESIAEGDLDDPTDADMPDPCALVTQEEVEGLFAEAAEHREDEPPAALGVSCLWQNVNRGETGQLHVLLVNEYEGEEFYGADTIDGETEIADLGDRAYVNAGSEALQPVEVQFVQDGKTVILNYAPVAEDVVAADHADALVALARHASARM